MKELRLEEMVRVEGGSWMDCFYTGVALVGLAASIASVPATGPIGVSAAISIGTTAIGAAGSGSGCVDSIIGVD